MDALRRAFNDVTLGYSRETLMGRTVYIKHLGYGDQVENDTKRDEYFNEARTQGLSTAEQKIVALIERGDWSEAKEKEIKACKTQIENLIEGKKKNMKMPSLVKNYTEQIKKEEVLYTQRLTAKINALGLTCESYADRLLNDWYIYTNLFADKALTIPFFTQEEFDYITEPDMDVVAKTYNVAMEICGEPNLKKLTIQPFFQNYFGLTGDNLSQFFGKPIAQLTFFQIRVLSLGAHFRHIFSSHDTSKFPEDVRNDPDLLTDYAAAANKGKEEMEKQGAYDEDSIVVGGKKEDTDVLGVKTNPGLASQIAKDGGNVVEWMRKRG
jgi:hypothetical protein